MKKLTINFDQKTISILGRDVGWPKYLPVTLKDYNPASIEVELYSALWRGKNALVEKT